MNDIKKLLGKRIKELRKSQGISQQQLAEIANIDQRNLSHVECDFQHLEMNETTMKDYIKNNIDYLPQDELKVVYRMIKSMR